MPTVKLDIHTAMAAVRWRGSWNMLRIRASVEGISVAPAMPSRARLAMSISALVDQAAIRDAAPNAAAPASSRRRRPIRSPSTPMAIRKPATRKP
jgi:hypothetical protein